MKNLSFFACVLFSSTVHEGAAQGFISETFYVSGNRILDPCGVAFVPRGINYAVLDDWDFPGNMNDGGELSEQIIQANPNSVRITWYNDYGQSDRPEYSLSDLDSVITRFKRNGIVSIITLMDVTCSNDYESYNSATAFWTDPAVVALVEQHRGNVMINIANEFGYVNWDANPVTAIETWKNNYIQTIQQLRIAGLTVPLIIDAPDCGTSLDALLTAGAEITGADVQAKTILSAHAYWSLQAGNDSVSLRNRLLQINAAEFPVILGEVANWQTDAQPCNYDIDYTALLKMCEELSIPWLAWAWTNDYCALRQMSENGNFSSLTPYGNVIVNDPQFGLSAHAVKTPYMLNEFSCLLTGIGKQLAAQDAFRIMTDVNGDKSLVILIDGNVSVSKVDGRLLINGAFQKNERVDISGLVAQLLIVSYVGRNGYMETKKVVLR